MRPVRKITTEEENFRTEPFGDGLCYKIKKNPVKAEPEGTIILMAFRITDFHPDCDGSLMFKADQIDKDGEITGWSVDSLGLSPNSDLVVTQEEFTELFAQKEDKEQNDK